MDEKELIRFIRRADREGWTEMYLFNKGLTSIPPEIGQLSKVIRLYLNGNRLTSLPTEMRQLTNLKSLNLVGNQFASLSAELSQLPNLTILSLGSNRLKSLPAEVTELTNLTSLDLSGNPFISLPAEIGQLTKLTSLDLSGARLTSLPAELWQLPNLRRLDLGGNRLTSLASEIGQLTNLESLNLNGARFTSVPTELWQLSNLRSLDLGGNRLTSLPSELWQLRNLTNLSLGSNGLTSLPAELWKLTNLTSLYLGGNGLTSLPPEVGQLTNLTRLDLSGNQLKSLPAEIGQLADMMSLNLAGNQLTSLPAEIGKLTNLMSLGLSSNRLTSLLAEIGQLANLTTLNLDGNQLASLSAEILQWLNLTSLSLGSSGFTSLPVELCKLTKLNSLYLGGNQLSSLPAEIGQLTNLTSLDLSGNQLISLPTEIGQLANLKTLNLDSNRLTSMPSELWQLSHVTTLNLERNLLRSVPPEIAQLKKLKVLLLRGNPLESPPVEVLNRGIEAIRDYFRQLEKEGKHYLYEAKLLVVGEAGAGKTTLAKKLEDPNYKLQDHEESTQGINVIEWHFTLNTGRDFRVNIWDFGGQEIYHATHQFFLTKRSLYALVADTRKEDTDFYYWINVVELLSDNSPVLIIKNEKQDRNREINENALRGQFTNIRETLATNLATNRGLADVEAEIKHHISRLPHVGAELPKTWVKVREVLEKDKRNYISLDEYLEICGQKGFRLQKDKLQLSGYLHDLGVCLHFQDDELLRKTVILKPEWGTGAVYKLLDDPVVITNKGRFNEGDLERIWHEACYANMHAELLRLMINFKLCYRIKGSNKYMVPELLGRNQPAHEWDDRDNLVVKYTYEFMPKGILTQFIVAMNPMIAGQDLVWREGVILEKDETRAEVIENYGKREIRIRVTGKYRREIMTIVVYEIDMINSAYTTLRFSKWIPCNCEACKSGYEPHFYSYDTLREFTADRQYEIQCQRKPYRMVDVLGLIDDAIDIGKRQKAGGQRDRRFHVALSFPGERRAFVEKVAGFLTEEFGKEKVFYDRNFEAELARLNLDTYLQEIYHSDSELIVVFLCAEYEKKEWCGLEWRAIRDLIKKRKASDVMPIRFDNTHITGLFSIDGYVSVENRKPKEIADRIIERYQSISARVGRFEASE